MSDEPCSVASGGVTEPASWDTDTLPQGDEKKAAVREMFDAIAPRYDLVNRIMTFRLDVRWRRKTVRDLALPARRPARGIDPEQQRHRLHAAPPGVPRDPGFVQRLQRARTGVDVQGRAQARHESGHLAHGAV